MGYPDNVLAGDEQVVLHRHPHWKRLLGPILILLLATALASFAGLDPDAGLGVQRQDRRLPGDPRRLAGGRRLADRLAVPDLVDNTFRHHRPAGSCSGTG